MTNLKPGDPVRYKGGCNNGQHKKGCQGTVANNGEIYYDGVNYCSNPSCWEKIEERKEITFDNLQVGDVVVDRNFGNKTVLGFQKLVLLSKGDKEDEQDDYYSEIEFMKFRLTILQPQAEEEMTMEQVCKALGKKIKIV